MLIDQETQVGKEHDRLSTTRLAVEEDFQLGQLVGGD